MEGINQTYRNSDSLLTVMLFIYMTILQTFVDPRVILLITWNLRYWRGD